MSISRWTKIGHRSTQERPPPPRTAEPSRAQPTRRTQSGGQVTYVRKSIDELSTRYGRARGVYRPVTSAAGRGSVCGDPAAALDGGIDGSQIPKRPIASPILRASATTSRPASSIARTDRLTAGRNKCTTNATVISAAAGVASRDGCPAMLSSVSFAAAAPITVSPTAVGLDRTLRTCVRGAAAARRTAAPNAAITISVTRFESALEIPYTAVVMRCRNSFIRLDTMIASPHSRRRRLRCSRRTGGADWLAGVADARSDQVWAHLPSMVPAVALGYNLRSRRERDTAGSPRRFRSRPERAA